MANDTDFKQTLKELAERLPDNLYATYYEDDYHGPNLDFDYGGNILVNQDDSQNGAGIITLLQYIESEGYMWLTSTMAKLPNELKQKYLCTVHGHEKFKDYSGLGATIAEAVAKAALEVARRMK